jgi:hypothetical protein
MKRLLSLILKDWRLSEWNRATQERKCLGLDTGGGFKLDRPLRLR